jgi:periplasmic protein TonB
MSPTVRGLVLTGHLVRVATLAVSAIAHVLVYGALSLAPASPPPPRTVVFVTDLIVTEPPAPIAPSPRLVTPPRPLVRPKPPKTSVEAAPVQREPKVEPPVEQNAPEPPVVTPPPMMAAAEPTRETIEAPPAPTPTVPTQPAPTPTAPTAAATTPAARNATPPAASPSVTMYSQTGSAAIAALPPAAPPGPLTRTAIPRGGYQVTPSYPATARRLGIAGTALLRVFVDAEGRVGDVVVKQSAGHPDLDRAAADAVRRWRFEPARRGAETVAMWVELPVEFQLR